MIERQRTEQGKRCSSTDFDEDDESATCKYDDSDEQEMLQVDSSENG